MRNNFESISKEGRDTLDDSCAQLRNAIKKQKIGEHREWEKAYSKAEAEKHNKIASQAGRIK